MINQDTNCSILSIAVVLLFAIVFFGCNEPKKKAITKKDKIEERDPIFWSEYNEVFGLLSAKYSIGVDTIENISVEYLRIFSPLEYSFLSLNSSNKDTTALDYFIEPRQSVAITINQAAVKYNLEKSKVASILFDFRLYFVKKEPESDY